MIKHHVEYYNGHIPIWVMVEHLTVGELGSFITYLDRPVRKKWVDQMDKNIPNHLIVEWVKTIQILRNTGAHCSRFYSKYFNYNPTLLRSDEKLILDEVDVKNLDRMKSKIIHSLFTGLVIMKNFYRLLGDREKDSWNVFVDKLKKKLSDTPEANISNLGFTKNWKEILEFKKDLDWE